MMPKDEVREIIRAIRDGSRFSAGDVGIEQATNRIMALERPDRTIEEVALHLGCPYCGRTPGNRCVDTVRGQSVTRPPHPSRIRVGLSVQQ